MVLNNCQKIDRHKEFSSSDSEIQKLRIGLKEETEKKTKNESFIRPE